MRETERYIERERERQWGEEREPERERARERQTERETDTEREREKQRYTNWERETNRERESLPKHFDYLTKSVNYFLLSDKILEIWNTNITNINMLIQWYKNCYYMAF